MAKLFTNLAPPKLDLPAFYPNLSPHMKRRVREQYMTEQEGLCHHCEHPLGKTPPAHVRELTIHEELFPKGFFNNPVHLHHDHETGMTLGAVHAQCNAVLWQYHGE